MSEQTKKIEELEATIKERDQAILAQDQAFTTLETERDTVIAERNALIAERDTLLATHQDELAERDEIIDGQAETIQALEAERDALKADPSLTPSFTLKGKTYQVSVRSFKYRRAGEGQEAREYTVAELLADAALQTELVKKGVGFLELTKSV
ncbi:hypothetical protein [Fibrella aquatica]|uniref:hypothetical protein n=1 Tax=Fibrella aquatica TaxID=3242487 RepID=UPI003521E3FA